MKTNNELTQVRDWFASTPIASTNPHWVTEARIILRLRAKGRTLRQIARVLDRIENKPWTHNRETVNRRIVWAVKVWRANHPQP